MIEGTSRRNIINENSPTKGEEWSQIGRRQYIKNL
jgi:hypothetical protein